MRLPLLSVFLLCSVAAAQDVTLRGKVEDVRGTRQFVVDCTDTHLTSSRFDLNAYVGQHVVLKGTRIAGPGVPLVEVISIALAKEIFEIPGNPAIGQKLRFSATYTPGSRVIFYAALGSGFRGLGRAGTFLLDPRSSFRASTGIIPALGQLETAIRMPDDPALVGLTAYGQAAILSGGALFFSNPDCKTIRG